MITGNSLILQYGKEATYGTLAPQSVRGTVSKAEFNVDIAKKDEGLISGGIAKSAVATQGIKATGSLSMPMRPNTLGDFLCLGLGVQATPTAHLSSTVAYDHEFTPVGGGENAILPSITAYLDKSVDVFAYSGMKVESLAISAEAGSCATLDVELIGRDEAFAQTLTPGLNASPLKSFRLGGGKVKFAGAEVAKISSVKLNWKNNCDGDSQYNDTGIHYGEPNPKSRELTADFEVVYSSSIEALRKNYWLTDDQFSVEITFESDDEIETGLKYQAKFEIPAVQIGSYSEAWSIDDKTTCSISVTAVENGIDPLMTATLTDARATKYLA